MTAEEIKKRHRIRREEREACATLVPTSWLDNLLSGPTSALPLDRVGRWNCQDIERLLSAIRRAILTRKAKP